MKTINDYRQQFRDQVKFEHIKYDWDAGHAYSYIQHPLMDELIELEFSDNAPEWIGDLICETDVWLSDNEELPLCEPGCCVTEEEDAELYEESIEFHTDRWS